MRLVQETIDWKTKCPSVFADVQTVIVEILDVLKSEIGMYINRENTGMYIRYPKEIMKMERHFSTLQRWLQK